METTTHRIVFDTIERRPCTTPVNLVVTSPPYPMIEMWDNIFNEGHSKSLEGFNVENRYIGMLSYLKEVFKEVVKLLAPGAIVCINIGDAVRSFEDHDFQLFNNHTAISTIMKELGLTQIPGILWHKATNAPNKFMGSGTLPVKAYVTLEHEHILIFRNGVRNFSREEVKRRKQSAFFFEERNAWFSDIWRIPGVKQTCKGIRTAAYPFEIPHRLINMFSIQGDTVLDPFFGTGTTIAAAAVNGRNSINFEINRSLGNCLAEHLESIEDMGVALPLDRAMHHLKVLTGNEKYKHKFYGPVVTKQEVGMLLPQVYNLYMEEKSPIEYHLECYHDFLEVFE